jgi:hypothetical protein
VIGGLKFGMLARRIELTVNRDKQTDFMARFHLRRGELGFKTDDVAGEGQYLQGGRKGGDFGSFTHAKTLKKLNITVADTSKQQVNVSLSLCYLDPIVSDTGEAAYRDAVLDYLAGQADVMKVVPNRSFLAFSSFVAGIWALAALPILRLMQIEPLLEPMTVLCVTNILTAIIALVAIWNKPRELTGTGLAIGGILTSVAAIDVAFLLTIGKHL